MTMYPFTATPPAIPARWTASRYRPATSIGNALMVILKAVLDVLVEHTILDLDVVTCALRPLHLLRDDLHVDRVLTSVSGRIVIVP